MRIPTSELLASLVASTLPFSVTRVHLWPNLLRTKLYRSSRSMSLICTRWLTHLSYVYWLSVMNNLVNILLAWFTRPWWHRRRPKPGLWFRMFNLYVIPILPLSYRIQRMPVNSPLTVPPLSHQVFLYCCKFSVALPTLRISSPQAL